MMKLGKKSAGCVLQKTDMKAEAYNATDEHLFHI